MSGIDAIETLSSTLDRLVAVIMVASDSSAEKKKRFRACRSTKLLPFRFLPKPVEFERLESLILEAHRELRAIRRLATGPEALPDEETAPIAPIVKPAGFAPPAAADDAPDRDATQPVTPVPAQGVPGSTPPVSPATLPASAMDGRFDEIGARLEVLEAAVRRLPRRPGFFGVIGRFLFRIFEIALAIAAVWAAHEMGWLDSALEFLRETASSLSLPDVQGPD